MAVTTFAAIDVASYDVSMEIFELSKKNGMKSLTRVRQNIELGKDTYALHRISMETLQALTGILLDYRRLMKEFGVSAYRACAKSAIRDAGNRLLVLDHIRRNTGIEIDVLSNSEQRFLGYKSIAAKGEEFQRFIQKGTAIIDVGGGSTQLSLFDHDALVMTQNIPLGSLRVRERLASFTRETVHYDQLVAQLVHKDVLNIRNMYLKDRKIRNIILVGDYFTNLIFENRNDLNKTETKAEFMEWYNHVVSSSPREIAEEMGISAAMSSVLIPTATVYRMLIEELDVETIWLPGIQLTDGIAYDYGLRQKIIRSTHDFNRDILMAAKNSAKRFGSYRPHNEKLMEAADAVFDVVKKQAGLDERARLLLRVACHLHDCGKYISMVNVADCSYHIIMSTEIIGLSDRERRIIANVVHYNTEPLDDMQHEEETEGLADTDYMLVQQLVSILRVANSLDQSYRQKVERLRVAKREGELIVTVDVNSDYTFERGIFGENVDLFQEIFDLRPVLKVRYLSG